MKRKIIGILAAAAVLAGVFATPAAAQYPPLPPGADCAATGISTTPSWRVNRANPVAVHVSNHGAENALCGVLLLARSTGFGGTSASVSPSMFRRVFVAGGDTVVVSYAATPRRTGLHRVIGCAWSMRPRDTNMFNACTSTTVNVTN